MRFPKPLRPGDLIAVTAPSSGVPEPALPRLDLVLGHLRSLGYRIVEGDCLRQQSKGASASRERRAAELDRFLHDGAVSAILPPWGGDLAAELLERIDFEALRDVTPKWLVGYSDISTLQLPLTLISEWATAHAPNLMDLVPLQTDPLTTSVLRILAADLSQPVLQESSELFQTQWVDFRTQVDAPLRLTEPTLWQRLDGRSDPLTMKGRLIGGCVDTIALLAGSPYGDVPRFVEASGEDGALLYLENAELAPPALVRVLLALRRSSWFDGLGGVLVGRSSGPEPDSGSSLSYVEALRAALGELPVPVLYDVDIGHRPPQFTLVNGAHARVRFDAGRGSIVQSSCA